MIIAERSESANGGEAKGMERTAVQTSLILSPSDFEKLLQPFTFLPSYPLALDFTNRNGFDIEADCHCIGRRADANRNGKFPI